MRHKRTINLYDEDDAHRELLIYLEGITGDARKTQVLVQMCLIGHRVMAYQESGEQAWFSVRNPDALQLSAGKRRGQPKLPPAMPSVPRTYEVERVEEGRGKGAPEKLPQSAPEGNAPHELVEPLETEVIADEPGMPGAVEQEQIIKNDAVEHTPHEESQFDLDEEYNTLKILQQMGSR